jgi:AGCS family alanine or glycine:cation symporter
MTGLVIVNSGEWMKGLSGAALTKQAFSDFDVVGSVVLTLGLLTFVFSTILGWSYYGEKAAEYLWGNKVVKPYRYLWVMFVMIGSVLSLNIVWTFADITNALMALPNLISLIFLSGIIVNETKKYLWNDNLDEVGEESRE